jgi:Domain of unknown function (DUF4388)
MIQDYIPFSEIVSEIGSLCKQKATGTLFIATRENRSAQIMLDKGEIVYIFFSSKRGQEALDLMAKMSEGRYRFQEGGIISRRMQLPPTQTILQILSTDSKQLPSASREQEKKASVRSGLSAEQKSILETCLAECIGPMAAIICEDHFSSAGDLSAAIEALAGEIPSAGQVKKFREMVSARLA